MSPYLLLLLSHVISIAGASGSARSLIASNNLASTPNENVVERAPTPVPTFVPFEYRNILFNYSCFWEPIPKREIESILASADESITDLVNESPFDSITNNRFEYRSPSGNTLISIQANVGKRITWTQLFRLLQGLYRFMIGMGVGRYHCQALDFTVDVAGQKKVGVGVIRYFPLSEGQVQKRDTTGVSNTSHNQTVLHSPNNGTLLSAPDREAIPFLWPISTTSLVLSFYYFGMPIPEQELTATLKGAMAQVRPKFESSDDQDDPIDGDAFDWTLPPNGDGTRTGVTVLSYPVGSMKVTWKQLFQVLSGLNQFTAVPDKNSRFQVLGFRIINQHGVKIGVGTVSYYPRRLLGIDGLASNARPDSLLLSNLTSTALAEAAVGGSILWPVRDTKVVLDFVFRGQEIPTSQLIQTLESAQQYILDLVREEPHALVVDGTFNYKPETSNAYINVMTTQTKGLSWLELSQVLFGVTQFCDNENHRVLVFDINVEGVRVGFGTLLYLKPNSTASSESNIVNATLNVPDLATGSNSISYNIPNTKDYLAFNSFGKPVPMSDVLGALSFVLQDISAFVRGIPNSRVPRNRYVHDADSGVSIAILPSTSIQMTWSQLDEILMGVMYFVSGVHPQRGGELNTHYQTLRFNIIMQKQGYIGTGILGYAPRPHVAVAKREVVGSRFDLLYPNDTNMSAVVPFRVPDTAVTLDLIPVSVSIPSQPVLTMLFAARSKIAIFVERYPNDKVPRNWFEYSATVNSGEETASVLIHGYVGQTVTWAILDDVFAGLIKLVSMVTDGSSPGLRFEVDVGGDGKVGLGTVWYASSRRIVSSRTVTPTAATEPKQETARLSWLNHLSTNSTAPLGVSVPYPVPSTPMTLNIYLNGPRIPLIYFSAFLTTALRGLHTNLTTIPDAPIPFNVYAYSDGASGLTFTYLGYSDRQWLTWRQLSWILQGVLRFVSGAEANCRAMAVEVDIRQARAVQSTRFGGFVLWYSDVLEE